MDEVGDTKKLGVQSLQQVTTIAITFQKASSCLYQKRIHIFHTTIYGVENTKWRKKKE